jgi:hypothetical protein
MNQTRAAVVGQARGVLRGRRRQLGDGVLGHDAPESAKKRSELH